MLLHGVLLIAGLAMLVGGGDGLVRGASALARQLGVSPLVVGLTVVAFGTSAPELAVNLLAAWSGDTALSFGNIIGSNIANMGLIVGCAALLRPLPVEGSVITREIPMMLLATAVVVIMGLDRTSLVEAGFDRSDGLILLLLFAVFLYYTIAEVLRRRRSDPLVRQARAALSQRGLGSLTRSVLLVVAGLLALIIGARLTIGSAAFVAEALGVPRVLIGLTVLAIGTSLPELVTSLVACWHGQADLAVGNIVGSNLFNLLFILAVTAVLRPLPVPESGELDLAVLGGFSLGLMAFAMSRGRRVVRVEGGVLLVCYVAYLAFRAWPA